MEYAYIVPDTQAWKILFISRSNNYSLLDILIRGYRFFLAEKVMEEISHNANPRNIIFSDLLFFIRRNLAFIGQVEKYSNALKSCQTFTQAALVFLAKRIEQESRKSFKEIMDYFDEGEINAVAHCLYLSRTRLKGPIFVTQDNDIVGPLREFFYLHHIGQVVRCDEFISSLDLQVSKSSQVRDLFMRFGVPPNNIPALIESWIDNVSPYSKTPCEFNPWCKSHTSKPCIARPCLLELEKQEN